ncbi:MAG: SgcJ/EcaC family oxidoreductase [Bacteroidales bacterium]|nr:SgcJ/EcaC family oxidoreductase [Bacteroidales bacterium]
MSKSEVHKLFQEWNNALQSKKTDQVLTLYAKEAILLPTLSPKVRHNHKEIGDYFDFFLSLSPSAEMKEENIRIFGDMAVNSGIYVFSVTQNAEIVEIPVRFTFVYKKFDSNWLIVEHHSSALPKVQ